MLEPCSSSNCATKTKSVTWDAQTFSESDAPTPAWITNDIIGDLQALLKIIGEHKKLRILQNIVRGWVDFYSSFNEFKIRSAMRSPMDERVRVLHLGMHNQLQLKIERLQRILTEHADVSQAVGDCYKFAFQEFARTTAALLPDIHNDSKWSRICTVFKATIEGLYSASGNGYLLEAIAWYAEELLRAGAGQRREKIFGDCLGIIRDMLSLPFFEHERKLTLSEGMLLDLVSILLSCRDLEGVWNALRQVVDGVTHSLRIAVNSMPFGADIQARSGPSVALLRLDPVKTYINHWNRGELLYQLGESLPAVDIAIELNLQAEATENVGPGGNFCGQGSNGMHQSMAERLVEMVFAELSIADRNYGTHKADQARDIVAISLLMMEYEELSPLVLPSWISSPSKTLRGCIECLMSLKLQVVTGADEGHADSRQLLTSGKALFRTECWYSFWREGALPSADILEQRRIAMISAISAHVCDDLCILADALLLGLSDVDSDRAFESAPKNFGDRLSSINVPGLERLMVAKLLRGVATRLRTCDDPAMVQRLLLFWSTEIRPLYAFGESPHGLDLRALKLDDLIVQLECAYLCLDFRVAGVTGVEAVKNLTISSRQAFQDIAAVLSLSSPELLPHLEHLAAIIKSDPTHDEIWVQRACAWLEAALRQCTTEEGAWRNLQLVHEQLGDLQDTSAKRYMQTWGHAREFLQCLEAEQSHYWLAALPQGLKGMRYLFVEQLLFAQPIQVIRALEITKVHTDLQIDCVRCSLFGVIDFAQFEELVQYLLLRTVEEGKWTLFYALAEAVLTQYSPFIVSSAQEYNWPYSQWLQQTCLQLSAQKLVAIADSRKCHFITLDDQGVWSSFIERFYSWTAPVSGDDLPLASQERRAVFQAASALSKKFCGFLHDLEAVDYSPLHAQEIVDDLRIVMKSELLPLDEVEPCRPAQRPEEQLPYTADWLDEVLLKLDR